MPTIKDIAQKTGLSVSTVSVVLRGEARRFGIREETEQRIRETAAELGYVRDDCARTMASGKSRVLGFIAGNRLQMEYAGRLLAGALTGATKLNYSLRFFLYDNNFKPEQLIMELQAQKIRGILLSGDLGHHRIDPLIRQCTNYGIQCGTVNISNRVSGIGVASDDSSGMEEMVRRLYALGHRKISYQTVDTEAEYARKREKGYLAGIRKCGLEASCFKIQISEEYQIDIRNILVSGCTALLCYSDHLAARLLQQAYQHGIRIPEELSICGFSGMQLANYAALPLSTIVQDFEGMGEKGAEMLIQLLENKSENKKDKLKNIVLPTTILMQTTTRRIDSCTK